MGALVRGLRLLRKSDNLQTLSPGDLLTNYRGPVCVWSAGPALAAWGPCSSLCRAGAQVAPARFLAAGGLDVPCRLLPCAPSLPLQLKTGCGVHLLVNTGAVKCARTIGRRLVCPVVVGCGFCNRVLYAAACVCNRHVQVFTFLSLAHPQPGSNRGSLGCELYTQPGSNWRPSAC